MPRIQMIVSGDGWNDVKSALNRYVGKDNYSLDAWNGISRSHGGTVTMDTDYIGAFLSGLMSSGDKRNYTLSLNV